MSLVTINPTIPIVTLLGMSKNIILTTSASIQKLLKHSPTLRETTESLDLVTSMKLLESYVEVVDGIESKPLSISLENLKESLLILHSKLDEIETKIKLYDASYTKYILSANYEKEFEDIKKIWKIVQLRKTQLIETTTIVSNINCFKHFGHKI